MIQTSEAFIEAMRDRNQTTSARLSIFSESAGSFKFLSSSIEPLLLENNCITDLGYTENNKEAYEIRQVHDLVTNETAKYAIFEGEGIELDGTNYVVDKTSKNQYGWYSEELTNSIGEFEAGRGFIWYCEHYQESELNIVFSKSRKEYAVNFIVTINYEVEDTSNPLGFRDETLEYTVTNNTDIVYTLENIPKFTGTVQISILDWSKGNSRAKVEEVYFGKMLEYTDEDIVSIKAKKGIDLINDTIESKTVDIILRDIDEEYNIFEPQGALANITKGSIACVEFGAVIDDFIYYVKTDEFILEKPKKEQNTLQVSINGYGRLMQYSDVDFTANYYEQQNAEDISGSIFGFESPQTIIIDDTIKNENVKIRTEYGTVKVPEGLRKMATALRANIVETIDNNILLKRIEEGTPIARINVENMLDSPEIEKEDSVGQININIYMPTDTGSSTIFNQSINLTQDQWNTFKYNTEHTCPPYTGKRTLKISGSDVTVDMQGVVFLENRAGWNPAMGGESTIVITGHVIEIGSTTQKYVISTDNTNTMDVDSESIGSTSQAQAVFNWLKNNLAKCFKYKTEIQDTFTYELGDTVWIESNIYVNGEMVVRKAIITGIEWEYNGALHYTLGLRGA